QVLQVVSVLRSPDLAEEFRVQHHLARVGGQLLQEHPLRASQGDDLAVLLHQPPCQVNFHIADRDNVFFPIGGADAATQDGTHTRAQLLRVERLDQIIVGPQVQSSDLVL